VYANWVWGGGWLAGLGKTHGLGHGHVDFAGSSVVHLTGGVAALVGAKMLGPRIGKFAPDGTPRAIPGHNVPMAVLGTFILAFGWFGFNAGSTLAGTDTRIAVIAVNTMLASAAGAVATCVYVWRSWGRPDVTMMCNGLLAGAVAVTAPCAFISPMAAVLIGSVSGVLVVVATRFVEERLRVDDPVGAIAVHGVNGTWGILALGLFANGSYGDGMNGVPGGVRGVLYGDSGQLVAGFVAILANVVWVGLTTLASLWVIGRLVGNRSDPEDEVAGLDVPEMGMEGYSREMLGLPPADPSEEPTVA
jgi:Amt family ammonium transporter